MALLYLMRKGYIYKKKWEKRSETEIKKIKILMNKVKIIRSKIYYFTKNWIIEKSKCSDKKNKYETKESNLDYKILMSIKSLHFICEVKHFETEFQKWTLW